MKLRMEDRGLFPKCSFREKASDSCFCPLEKLWKLGGSEGSNCELPVRDEFGMGSEFEGDSRRNVGDWGLDGRRIEEMHDVRVMLIDDKFPRSLWA
jgi:hypothetical protein